MGSAGVATGNRGRNYRAQVKDLVEGLEAMLSYPTRPGQLIIGPDNTLYWEDRDKIHELGGDNLPEVKRLDRKILKEALTWGGVWYDPPEDREGKPYSHWWWWLDKILKGELPKELLPEHLRNLV
jgi:hypothetical protein